MHEKSKCLAPRILQSPTWPGPVIESVNDATGFRIRNNILSLSVLPLLLSAASARNCFRSDLEFLLQLSASSYWENLTASGVGGLEARDVGNAHCAPSAM